MDNTIIRDLFAKDINRSINGVVKVQDSKDGSIRQELDEYVVTRELQRHFAVKVADGALAADLAILEQVAQHLEEVRFTGTEETTDPHADLVGACIDGIAVGLEERGKVPLQL